MSVRAPILTGAAQEGEEEGGQSHGQGVGIRLWEVGAVCGARWPVEECSHLYGNKVNICQG